MPKEKDRMHMHTETLNAQISIWYQTTKDLYCSSSYFLLPQGMIDAESKNYVKPKNISFSYTSLSAESSQDYL
jgi:hypothetical protein